MNDLGDETWGAENREESLTDCTDGTDGSDFTPNELARMTRKISDKTAPLPKGVQDVQWQPPTATGLEHSSAIFKTEYGESGTLHLSREGISDANCHFRSWQEDNGVAGTFGSTTVQKELDGKRLTVSVAKWPSQGATDLISSNTTIRPNSADAVLQATAMGKARDLRVLRKCSSAEEDLREVREHGPSPEEDATGRPSLPSADGVGQKESAAPRGLSAEGAGSDSVPDCCAQSAVECETPALGGVDGRPSLSTTVASDRAGPATPRRPSEGVASSHAREPRPGRSLATQGAVDGVGTSTLFNQEEGAEDVRHPSPATPSGGNCQRAAVACESDDGHASSGVATTSRGEMRAEGRRMSDGQLGEQRQEGNTNGLCDGNNEPLSSTTNSKVEQRKTWWGGSRTPKVPSPRPPQRRRWFTSMLPGHRQRTRVPP